MNTNLLKSMLGILVLGIAGNAYATSLKLDTPPGLTLNPGDAVGVGNFIPNYSTSTVIAFTDNWDFQLAKTAGVGDTIFTFPPPQNVSGLTANLYLVTGGVLGPSLISGLNFSYPSLGATVPGNYYDLQMTGTVTGPTGGGYGGTISVVPVPAAAWLLLSGLVGVGAMARRRKIEAIDALS